MFLFLNVATLDLIAQTQLYISSSDSSLFILKVNNEFLADSMFSEVLIEYNSSAQVNLEIQDSLGTAILVEDLFVNPGVKSDYSFDPSTNSPELMLLSQSTPQRSLVSALNSVESDSATELPEGAVLPFVVTSKYKSGSFPNKTEIEAIENLTFERDKLKAIKKLILEEKINQNELILILKKVSFEDKRAELIIEHKPQIKGLLDESSLVELFKLEKYRKKVRHALDM